MTTNRSNNMIPVIHRLITSDHGENYWFNGCAKYVMECLGEKDFDYEFFAGLTGDVLTQHYTFTKYSGEALSSYMMEENMGGNPVKYVEAVFEKCGYAATYVPNRDLRKNTRMYLNTLIAYIDQGIPVIREKNKEGVYVGYEDYGKILLLITGDSDQPERIPLDEALQEWADPNWPLQSNDGWIFVGDKKESRPLAQIYREAICEIAPRFSVKTNTHCFGPEAFRAWEKDIATGKFDGMKNEEFNAWAMYTNYVCVLATNGSCCHEFLKRARELNPDMGFLEEISVLYRKTAQMWGGDDNHNDPDSLEALGGGFNITLETLQNEKKRAKIAAKICECADVTDEIEHVLIDNLITFRPARPEDADVLFSVKIAAFSDEFREFHYAEQGYLDAVEDCAPDKAKDGGMFGRDWHKSFDSGQFGDWSLVIEADGKPIGQIVAFSGDNQYWKDNYAEYDMSGSVNIIFSIYVSPEYKNMGVGERAMFYMESLHPADKWILDTPRVSPKNKRFYEKCGYTQGASGKLNVYAKGF